MTSAVSVRVLVYNVRGFRDGADRVAGVIERFQPDLVLLNETGPRRRLRRLARRIGMEHVADPWSPLRRRVKEAVLARSPWVIVERQMVRFEGSARWYPRGALIVRLARDGVALTAAATHLGLHPGERLAHARRLLELLETVSEPVILGGDLNETAEGRAVSLLAEHMGDAWLLGGGASGPTFPASEPTARIDHLFVSEGIRVQGVFVPGGAEVRLASDHRPVVAELTLPPSG